MNKFRQIWQNPKHLLKGVVALAVVLLGIHGVSLWAGAGQVIDAETGKPLEGVFVIAMWEGSGATPVSRRSVCYSFAITQTDTDGQYRLPTFSWNLLPFYSNRHRQINVYLAGYETLPNDILAEAIIKMRRRTETVKQRLDLLVRSTWYENCTSQEERKSKLGPLYKAHLDEAKSILAAGGDIYYVASGHRDTYLNILTRRWESAVLPFDEEHRYSDGTLKK